MSETGGKKVRVNLDAALRDWPDAEPSAENPDAVWEARAQSVMGRLRRGERDATAAYVRDDDLTKPPLGLSSEDGGHDADVAIPTAAQADRERDRRSLKDLAKLAGGLTPPPPAIAPSSARMDAARAEDSGIVDLAAAAKADPGAEARAQTTPLAAHGLYDDPQDSPDPPAQTATAPKPTTTSVPPASHGRARAPSRVSSPPRGWGQPSRNRGNGTIAIVFGGILALSGAAAGGFFYMKAQRASDAAIAAAATENAPAVAAPAVATATATAPLAANGAAPLAANGSVDDGAGPDSLPAAHGKPGRRAHDGSGPGAGVKVAAGPNERNEKPGAKAENGGESSPPPGANPDLGSALAAAAGPAARPTPAAHVAGSADTNIPQKPSQGAVTGALGAVLPGARSCLGPDDPISRAAIVFNSDGSVASVSVSGAAAGTTAESCIKGSLSKAKVQPFAEPSYTANITIRHN